MSADRSCEVCGSGEHSQLYEIDRYTIVKCDQCGLVFVANPPSDDELIALYGESYYEDPQAVGYGGYGDAEQRKRHHSRGLLKQIEAIHPPGDLLEIGCAYGYFLDEARLRGWRTRGVEPSVHAATYAREQFELDVSSEPFTALAPDHETVDTIAMWDVIEHLPNPRETIERARAWLRPGGVIAISTGDVGSLSARLHGAEWSLMTPPWHQFYFSRATMRRLLESAGLEVVQFGGDGNVAVDRGSERPRVPGILADVLTRPTVSALARRLGAGGIMFAFARKVRA